GRLPNAIHLSRRVEVGRVRRSRFARSYAYKRHGARLARKLERHETMGCVLADVDIAPRDGLCLAPLAVGLLFGDPDSHRPHTSRFTLAHEVQGVAVGCDPRLLVDAITVAGVWQALCGRPILGRPRPLATLSYPVGDKDIGRTLHPRVAVVKKASKVDGVPVRRDCRLVGAKVVVRRERQLPGDEGRGTSIRPVGQDRGRTYSCCCGGY